MMRHAVKLLGTTPDETVIIGDRMDTDILAGIESEFETVLVLSNHPLYNPTAMLLAIRAHLALGKMESAREAWEELRRRYPLKAEEYRGDAALKPLFEEKKK